MSRKLVTLRQLDAVVKHPNADALELGRIGGWQVVLKKDEFVTGDYGVFFEIDSILPDRPEFKFLIDKQGKQYTNGLGARLKTVKLRGAVSQGLMMPVSMFPEIEEHLRDEGVVDTEFDYSEMLGVYKYEPAEQAGSIAGNARGEWPSWMPKTDQDRIENCYAEMFEIQEQNSFAGKTYKWWREEKLEGSSITIYVKDGVVGVTSHNVDLKLDESNAGNAFVQAAMSSGLMSLPDHVTVDVAIRAELCGPKIQGNIYKLEKQEFFVFDVWLGKEQRYMTPSERRCFLTVLNDLGIKLRKVPEIDTVAVPLLSLDEIISSADGRSLLADTKREGVVWKGYQTVKDRFGREYVPSFKAVSRDYLLSEK